MVRGMFKTSDGKPLSVTQQDLVGGEHRDSWSHVHSVPLAPLQRVYKNGYRYARNAVPERAGNPIYNPWTRTSVFVKRPAELGDSNDAGVRHAWTAIQRWHRQTGDLNPNDVHHYEVSEKSCCNDETLLAFLWQQHAHTLSTATPADAPPRQTAPHHQTAAHLGARVGPPRTFDSQSITTRHLHAHCSSRPSHAGLYSSGAQQRQKQQLPARL